MSGIKRSSPGADEKKNPLAAVELSDEDAVKLNQVQKVVARTELAVEIYSQKKLKQAFEKRRATLKTIPKFWPVALMNHDMFGIHVQHSADQLALSYLEDVWVERDAKEPRCFTIEFHFKENPYFSDSVLKKEFKYISPPAATEETPDEDGITDSMVNFSWERDVEGQATTIHWKDEAKALTKIYPREVGDEEDDMPVDSGSFFHFFESAKDVFDIGLTIANDIFPEAVDYFLGNAGGEDADSEDEDSEDDDDNAEEIDLEKPKKKKARV